VNTQTFNFSKQIQLQKNKLKICHGKNNFKNTKTQVTSQQSIIIKYVACCVTKKGGIQRNREDTTLTKPLPTLLRSDRASTMQSHNYATYNSNEMNFKGKIP
jgi:hypothetical protein